MTTKKRKSLDKYIIDSREIINHIVGKINSGEIELKGWELTTKKRGVTEPLAQKGNNGNTGK